MLNACRDGDIEVVQAIYNNNIDKRVFSRAETLGIAQALHHFVRTNQKSLPAKVMRFVHNVVQDIMQRRLPSHPPAFVHLLGIYRDLKNYDYGRELFYWVTGQDDSYVSQAVYGAGIDLLAQGNCLPLYELEKLYVDALRRFPGTFAEYHLSPGAIIANRSQPTLIPQIPVALFQGILTARLIHKDWKNSYLGLDTALRLYPSQLPAHFFNMFVKERPLEEAYTVFLVACRSGVVPSQKGLSTLITDIKWAMEHCESFRDRMLLLRASANAMYAYLQAGGSLEPIHVASFLNSLSALLPELAPGKDYEGVQALIRNRIATLAYGTLSSLLQAGMPPSPNHLTALVRVAGKLRVPDLLNVSLEDIKSSQADLGAVGLRALLVSAGDIGRGDLIEETWARIIDMAESDGKPISDNNPLSWKDWMTLSKACKGAQHTGYLHSQLLKLEYAIPKSHKNFILATRDEMPPPRGTTTLNDANLDIFEAQYAELDKQLKNILAITMSGQRLDMRRTPFYMSLDPEKLPLASMEDLQKVYDEYTVDSHQPRAQDEKAPVVLSNTGIPLDELRFQNWVSIVELMDQAQRRAGLDEAQATTKLQAHVRTTKLQLSDLRERVKALRETPVSLLTIKQKPSAQLKEINRGIDNGHPPRDSATPVLDSSNQLKETNGGVDDGHSPSGISAAPVLDTDRTFLYASNKFYLSDVRLPSKIRAVTRRNSNMFTLSDVSLTSKRKAEAERLAASRLPPPNTPLFRYYTSIKSDIIPRKAKRVLPPPPPTPPKTPALRFYVGLKSNHVSWGW